ncbi:MAG: diphosphomevalonate decarboxylase, partial [Pseudomonadota bacterium]
REAVLQKDFAALAAVSEASALTMHGLAMSARPGVLYFNATTMACLHRIIELRQDGVAVFFTVDAGPQVKAVCLPAAVEAVKTALADIAGVTEMIHCRLGPGAHALNLA